MRILMSLALGLACTAGVFAADHGTTPGVDGDHTAATSQQPINTVDPVTGKPIDATLPAVLVPNAEVAAGSPSGTSGGVSGTNMGVQGQEQQWVAIGISEQSSAEQIRANPHKFLQAARLNRKAQEGMVGAGSSSGLDQSGDASSSPGSDWNQSSGQAGGQSGQQPSQSGQDANAPAPELQPSGQSSDNGQSGTAPGMESPSSSGGEMNEPSSSGGAATEATQPDAVQPAPAQPEAGSASGSSSMDQEDAKPDVGTTTGSGADLSGDLYQEKIDEVQK